MNMQDRLNALAQQGAGASPWSFEEFEQRQARAVSRRRAAAWSAVGSVAALGLVVAMAVVTQRPQHLVVAQLPSVVGTAVADDAYAPALVNLDQFDVTSELEEHIALLDAELSAARVYAVPAERLQQLEYTREQLSTSLQRVSYAHSLMNL
jgi:hypothetical protein